MQHLKTKTKHVSLVLALFLHFTMHEAQNIYSRSIQVFLHYCEIAGALIEFKVIAAEKNLTGFRRNLL